LWVLQGRCLIFGALFPSKSGLTHKHVVKHITKHIHGARREKFRADKKHIEKL
jgi:hypothetical protein